MTLGEKLTVSLDGNSRTLQTFPDLSKDAFQHPDDSDAGRALRSVPLIPQLFSMFSGNYWDQKIRMDHLTNNIRVGPKQAADLYSKFLWAVRILDLPEIPELYLDSHPMINAYSAGINHPIVTLTYGCLTLLTEGELLAIISHELGHIKCQHGLNQSLGSVFASAGVSGISGLFPVVGSAMLYGAKAALSHWARMAEFSCDRAALLVVQDSRVVASALSKIAGFHEGVVPDFNFESLYTQLDDYNQYDQNALQSLVKIQKVLVNSVDNTWLHPSPVLRIKRVLDWGKSDHYNDILAGIYKRGAKVPVEIPAELPAEGNVLKCASCGAPALEDATFCSRCGSKL